jgi:hypothetical protein
MSTVGLNLYLNILIVGSAELVAYIVSNKMISVLQRQKVLCYGLLIASLLSISFIFLTRDEETCPDICAIVIV